MNDKTAVDECDILPRNQPGTDLHSTAAARTPGGTGLAEHADDQPTDPPMDAEDIGLAARLRSEAQALRDEVPAELGDELWALVKAKAAQRIRSDRTFELPVSGLAAAAAAPGQCHVRWPSSPAAGSVTEVAPDQVQRVEPRHAVPVMQAGSWSAGRSALASWLQGSLDQAQFDPRLAPDGPARDMWMMLVLANVVRRLERPVDRRPESAVLMVKLLSDRFLTVIREPVSGTGTGDPDLLAWQFGTALSPLARSSPGAHGFTLLARFPRLCEPPTLAKRWQYRVGNLSGDEVSQALSPGTDGTYAASRQVFRIWQENRLDQLFRYNAGRSVFSPSPSTLPRAAPPSPMRIRWVDRIIRTSESIVRVLSQPAPSSGSGPSPGAEPALISVAHTCFWKGDHRTSGCNWDMHQPYVPRHSFDKDTYMMWSGDVRRDVLEAVSAGFTANPATTESPPGPPTPDINPPRAQGMHK